MSGWMTSVISAIHVLSCVALVVSILLQSGKGGGLAGAFGAGSSQTLFGGRGAATFLTRASTVLAVIFFVTSLTLGLTSSRPAGSGRSLIQEEARRRAAEQNPAQSPPAAPQGAPTQGAPGQTQNAPIPSPTPANPPTQSTPAPPTQSGTVPEGSGGSK
jgi:preprotein translocase subunit SecG